MISLKKVALPVTIGVGVAAAAVTAGVIIKKKLDDKEVPPTMGGVNGDGMGARLDDDMKGFNGVDDFCEDDFDADFEDGFEDDDLIDDEDFDALSEDEIEPDAPGFKAWCEDDFNEADGCGCDENCGPECTCGCHEKKTEEHPVVSFLKDIGVTDKDVLCEIGDTLEVVDEVAKKSCKKAKNVAKGVLQAALRALED